MRALTAEERGLLTKLLHVGFPGHEALLVQLEDVVVEDVGPPDAPYRRLAVADDVPHAAVVRRVPIEGEAADTDGVTVHLLVHVVDGRLRELEIYREDGQAVQSMPPPEAVQVLQYP